MRELPMMEQVEDTSFDFLLAVIFHCITEIRRVQIVQRVGSIYVFREVRLPSDVASCLALSFGPIRWNARNRSTIVDQHVEGFETMLHLWRAMCKTARSMPRPASPMHALDRHAPRRSLHFWPSW